MHKYLFLILLLTGCATAPGDEAANSSSARLENQKINAPMLETETEGRNAIDPAHNKMLLNRQTIVNAVGDLTEAEIREIVKLSSTEQNLESVIKSIKESPILARVVAGLSDEQIKQLITPYSSEEKIEDIFETNRDGSNPGERPIRNAILYINLPVLHISIKRECYYLYAKFLHGTKTMLKDI